MWLHTKLIIFHLIIMSELISVYGPPHVAKQKQDDQLEHTYSSYVRIWDVALKTCQKRWMIGRGGERGSGISVLVARHDDDDDYIWGPYFFSKILAKKYLPCFIWKSWSIWLINVYPDVTHNHFLYLVWLQSTVII